MRERLVMLLATGGGVGHWRGAPGTVGSLVGLGYWWLLTLLPAEQWYYLAFMIGCVVAVVVAGAAARRLGTADPPAIVIDEICAVPLALAGVDLSRHWWPALVGFGLFRLFDIWKPWVVGRAQKIPGGLGIVLDDLAAALLAALITQGAVLAQLVWFR